MIILLTNDDGYQAQGLKTLEEVLVAAGHEVWVCAPSNERSAQSQAITISGQVKITRYGERHFHCSGTPADSILYGLGGNFVPAHPDIVISGINHGYNASTDIIYSGTVGAAREAVLRGLPALAISARKDRKRNHYPFVEAAQFLTANLETFLPFCNRETLININVPPNPSGRWRAAEVGLLEYFDVMEKMHSPRKGKFDASSTKLGLAYGQEEQEFHIDGEVLISIASGGRPEVVDNGKITDYMILSEGDISVTPLEVLPVVHQKSFEELQRLEEQT